jgi:hypothetical protein
MAKKDGAYMQILLALGKQGYDMYDRKTQRAALEASEGKSTGKTAEGTALANTAWSLANAYANDGEISDKEIKQIATQQAMSYGKGKGYSLMGGKDMSTGQSAGYRGAMAGVGSLASDYAADRDLDYGKAAEKAGIAATTEYGKKAIYKAAYENALKGGMGEGAATGKGAEAAGVFGAVTNIGLGGYQYAKSKSDADSYYKRRQAQTYGKAQYAGQTIGTIADLAGGYGVGSMVGGVLGGLYAGSRYKPKDWFAYQYEDPENKAIRFNPQTGKFEANKVTGMRKFTSHLGVNLGEKDVQQNELEYLTGTQRVNQERADILNQRLANFDNLDANAQLQMQGIMSGQIDPTMTETLKHYKTGADTIGTSQVDISKGAYDISAYQTLGADDGMGAYQDTASTGLFNTLQQVQQGGQQLTQNQQRTLSEYENFQRLGMLPEQQQPQQVTDFADDDFSVT